MIGKSLADYDELGTAIAWEQARRIWFLTYNNEPMVNETEARIDFYLKRLEANG